MLDLNFTIQSAEAKRMLYGLFVDAFSYCELRSGDTRVIFMEYIKMLCTFPE